MNSKCIIVIFAATWLLLGCATQVPGQADNSKNTIESQKPEIPVKPIAPVKRPGEIALESGVSLYLQGDYDGAIKSLQEAPDIWTDTIAVQVEALKYSAFSACLLNRRTVCRSYFTKIFQIDNGFELRVAELGHPLWMPSFDAAKKAFKASPSKR